ncbi:PH domain-containing protein [Mobilicoccus pelagius]|uniref:YdbS-like PH domain-containing protein n=1 Tax=Mobilicoccus pelagius NBRC 104925 TaxID=1089455 RepID=H5USI9_9MICO|nr:PH domain-containing protein [Mobilicoccus pelagius]GAB48697.1 hypothetical protein MOPEL_078_00860 [Mobilicoccus pelagius NBRC 104925]
MDSSTPVTDMPLPPDSWPGAGGRRSVAPEVPGWPGQRPHSETPGASWPGAASAASTPAAPARDLDDAELRELTLRRPANRVSPRAMTMWRLTTMLLWLVPLVAVVVWMVLDDAHRSWQIPAVGLVVVLGLLGVFLVPWWRYRVHRWEVTDTAVYTQSGWLFQQRRIAPISRIQTVDSEFGPLEQLFGLGTLTVTTASAAGPLRVSGLEKGTVDILVSDLTRITAKERGDAT